MRASRSSRKRPAATAACRSRFVPQIRQKSLATSVSAPIGMKRFFLDGMQEQGLFVRAEFADLIEEQQAPSATRNSPSRSWSAPVNAPLRCRTASKVQVAAQGRAVHLNERAAEQAARLLQFVDPAGEPRLAGTGRSGQAAAVPPSAAPPALSVR